MRLPPVVFRKAFQTFFRSLFCTQNTDLLVKGLSVCTVFLGQHHLNTDVSFWNLLGLTIFVLFIKQILTRPGSFQEIIQNKDFFFWTSFASSCPFSLTWNLNLQFMEFDSSNVFLICISYSECISPVRKITSSNPASQQ